MLRITQKVKKKFSVLS